MPDSGAPVVVLTGATGFLGHYVLALLLQREQRCIALVRPPVARARERLLAMLGALGVDLGTSEARGGLVLIEAEVPGSLPRLEGMRAGVLVHAAAATNFRSNRSGDPIRTNVDGTRAVLSWAAESCLRHVCLISSAYVCGQVQGDVRESFGPRPSSFHNAYEESKWRAEALCVSWAESTGAALTIVRPSVIVGSFDTGRATKFNGFYISARATELLDRMHRDDGDSARRAIDLRIAARPLDCQNIVPVDYVARMVVAAAGREAGGVYHVVHPAPPSNLEIKQAFESYFGIGGGRFVPPETFPALDLSDRERQFYGAVDSIRHYFDDTPTFVRTRAAALEVAYGIDCPSYDTAAIGRLLRFAQRAAWGKRRTAIHGAVPGCAAYFESFLPHYVERSRVAEMTSLSAKVAFVIEDEPDGRWVCAFDHGRLREVHRGQNGLIEDFGYRATREVFWESISGRPHPQELFLTGRADMFGDLERALKMSMVLHAFTQEYPCDPATLDRFVAGR